MYDLPNKVGGGAPLDRTCMIFQIMWVEVLRWIERVWSSKECVCCACDLRV